MSAPNHTPGLAAQAMQSARGAQQKPVGWWKRHPDGSVSLVEYEAFLAGDALSAGWRPLVFGDAVGVAARRSPQGGSNG